MELKNITDNTILVLPDDLLWIDEQAWSPIAMSTSYLLNGALLIQTGQRQAGRPITLTADQDMAWVTRAVVQQLWTWASQPINDTSGRFLLTFKDARSFTVVFRHTDTAIEAEPVLGIPAQADTDYYRITLRFMEV